MALNELFLEIYIVILCISGMLMVVESQIDTPIVTPFDTSLAINVTAEADPQFRSIFNPNNTSSSSTIVGNLSSGSLQNSTIGGTSAILAPVDFIWQPLAFIWAFIKFITGAYIFDILGLFGFPSEFTLIMQGIIGILLARIILYYWIGR